jgi:hypothetical protein
MVTRVPRNVTSSRGNWVQGARRPDGQQTLIIRYQLTTSLRSGASLPMD